MYKILLSIIALILPVTAFGQEIKSASENEQSLLHKSEIVELIQKAGRISATQRKEKIGQLWAKESGSATPRSDFLYCTAFAYLNDPRAQACLARSFENGTGIVGNYTDAYVWYTIALEQPIDDADLKQKLQTGQARVKMTLLSVYPAPSDFELEESVNQQKEKIEAYATEAGVVGH
jgi:TPR repeat protein